MLMTRQEQWEAIGGRGQAPGGFVDEEQKKARLSRASIDLGSSALDLVARRIEHSNAMLARRSAKQPHTHSGFEVGAL